MSHPLTPPDLQWDNGVPASAAYGDVYYSAEGGLEESRYVFLDGNDISGRLTTWNLPWFTVGETGFGTGLNLLALWQLWDGLPEPRPNLRFLTTELHPLPLEALETAHRHWPELEPYAGQLRAVYPPFYPGPHRRYLAGGRIEIEFLWGEAAERLKAYACDDATPVDAWFLDGFSPAKNPSMWRPELYRAIAGLSAPDATLATFTAAGHVRQGLQQAGFTVARRKGFGHKRHMSTGRLAPRSAPAVQTASPPAIVIGAGIAGIGAAWRLARRGRQVILIDAAPSACMGASGNPASAFTPYFTADWSLRGRIFAGGFGFTRHLWDRLEAAEHTIAGARCGVLMADAGGNRIERLFSHKRALALPDTVARIVSASEAGAIAGVPMPTGGVFYPQGGWLRMSDLCAALLAEAGTRITHRYGTEVTGLFHDSSRWRVELATQETLDTDHLTLACGATARHLLPGLEIHPVRGQLLRFPTPPILEKLQTVVNFGHYLTPSDQGWTVFGSTFQHHDSGTDARPADTRALLDALREFFPDVDTKALEVTAEPWVGIRSAVPQRQPLISQATEHPEGLFLHLAHGARGSLSGLLPFAIHAYA